MLSRCCSCPNLACTGNRLKRNELKVFDAEPTMPLMKPKPRHNSMTLSLSDITNLLYNRKKYRQSETHYLGSEISDQYFCLFCDNDKSLTFIQYEINNNCGNETKKRIGNQYIIQYSCIPCSKRLQPQLKQTIGRFYEYVSVKQSHLIKQILNQYKIPRELEKSILVFLPFAFVALKSIKHHRAKQEDLSIWVEEQIIR